MLLKIEKVKRRYKFKYKKNLGEQRNVYAYWKYPLSHGWTKTKNIHKPR